MCCILCKSVFAECIISCFIGKRVNQILLDSRCNKLDMTGLPYFVGNLDIGDYCFFSGNRLCPILVERKSIEDIAHSIYDGRWERQKQRMYIGQFVFGYGDEASKLCFLVEGMEDKHQVTGGFIGNRYVDLHTNSLDAR